MWHETKNYSACRILDRARVVVVSCYYMPRDDPTCGWYSCERSLRLNRLFGCFPQPLYGGCITLLVCGFSSDLDQNRAVLWSKSELETPETPETLETLETLDVDAGIAFL